MDNFNKVKTTTLIDMMAAGEKIVGLTAWDHLSATYGDTSGAEIILVGDSLSMTIRGDENTLGIDLLDMIYHAKMVSRGVKRALVIADMPFMSYQVSSKQALISAGRFVKESGVEAVKIEGGAEMVETASRIIAAGIPVMGHIGLKPQSVNQIGGMKVQGRSLDEAQDIIDDAKSLEKSGIFALVLECIPAELSSVITQSIRVPTIGIGAGLGCDGQIQVTADLLGLLDKDPPKHARKYIDGSGLIKGALRDYVDDVKKSNFPKESNSFKAASEVMDAIRDKNL